MPNKKSVTHKVSYVRLPIDLHNRFRWMCGMEGRKINQVMNALISRQTALWEQKNPQLTKEALNK